MDFKTYLENNLSKSCFDRLHELLDISKHATTKIIRNPKSITIEQAKVLAKELKVGLLPFLMEFKIGWSTITLEEIETVSKLCLQQPEA